VILTLVTSGASIGANTSTVTITDIDGMHILFYGMELLMLLIYPCTTTNDVRIHE
jgi:hypothetical protein